MSLIALEAECSDRALGACTNAGAGTVAAVLCKVSVALRPRKDSAGRGRIGEGSSWEVLGWGEDIPSNAENKFRGPDSATSVLLPTVAGVVVRFSWIEAKELAKERGLNDDTGGLLADCGAGPPIRRTVWDAMPPSSTLRLCLDSVCGALAPVCLAVNGVPNAPGFRNAGVGGTRSASKIAFCAVARLSKATSKLRNSEVDGELKRPKSYWLPIAFFWFPRLCCTVFEKPAVGSYAAQILLYSGTLRVATQ